MPTVRVPRAGALADVLYGTGWFRKAGDAVASDPLALANPISGVGRAFADDLARAGTRTWGTFGDDAARAARPIADDATRLHLDPKRLTPHAPPRAPAPKRPVFRIATGVGIGAGLTAAGIGGGVALARIGQGSADANRLRNTPIDTNGDGVPDSLPKNPNEGPNWNSFFGGVGEGVTTAGPIILLAIGAYVVLNNVTKKEGKAA